MIVVSNNLLTSSGKWSNLGQLKKIQKKCKLKNL